MKIPATIRFTKLSCQEAAARVASGWRRQFTSKKPASFFMQIIKALNHLCERVVAELKEGRCKIFRHFYRPASCRSRQRAFASVVGAAPLVAAPRLALQQTVAFVGA
ncbi:hypothetical protein [Candidatus Accumulibacter sp. ACC003]|uniref:hypothetical protein n=1 Tax=Candidatus Accumulibacter sp. ACC003 TaxID=2823334 RepID=UPI0025C06D6D|nr:hypothetical protein [Candidatus Accumulibacter sp. ACC003]